MSSIFNRWLPAVTLAVWGSVLLFFALSGKLSAFLAPAYRPWVLPAGILLAVMALVFLLFPADAACCRSAECGHPLSRYTGGKWLTFLILVVPVAVAAKYTPSGFSLNAMENRGIVTDAASLPSAAGRTASSNNSSNSSPSAGDPLALPLPAADGSPTAPAPAPAPVAAEATPAAQANSLDSYVQKTKEGYLEAEVLDLLYAAQDPSLRQVFEGKTVQLIGQLMPDPNGAAAPTSQHRFKAVRMFMTCCAADARPVATSVEAADVPALPEMSWIKITGVATFPLENGRRAALLQAKQVEKTEPPEESMLY